MQISIVLVRIRDYPDGAGHPKPSSLNLVHACCTYEIIMYHSSAHAAGTQLPNHVIILVLACLPGGSCSFAGVPLKLVAFSMVVHVGSS